jgi:tetratricopeptide (TPR) repeat protein
MAARRSRSYFVIVFSLFFLFVSQAVFAYPDSQALDKMWNDRQSKAGQKVILNFIFAEEPIPQNFDIAWRVARLVYFTGNFGIAHETLKKEQKIKLFKYGYIAADIARTKNPDKVEGYYWYGVNLGSYGLAKGIFSALGHAEDALNSLLKSAELDPTYHWAGPYRVLGRFYQEAPSFLSFGDKKKAEEYFNRAIELAPDYRLNTINLGVLKKEQGNIEAAIDLLKKAKAKPNVDGKLEETRYLEELDKGIASLELEQKDE